MTNKNPLCSFLCDGRISVQMDQFDGFYGLLDATSYGPVIRYEAWLSVGTNAPVRLPDFYPNATGPAIAVTSNSYVPSASQYSVTVRSVHQTLNTVTGDNISITGSTTMGSTTRNYGDQFQGFNIYIPNGLGCSNTSTATTSTTTTSKKGGKK